MSKSKQRKKFDIWMDEGCNTGKNKDKKREKRKNRILEKTSLLYLIDKEEDRRK